MGGNLPVCNPTRINTLVRKENRRLPAGGAGRCGSALFGGRDDDDLVGPEHVEGLADLRVEQVWFDLVRPQVRDPVLELGAFTRCNREALLRKAQLLRQADPG